MKIKVITREGKPVVMDVTTVLVENDASDALAFFSQVGRDVAFATAKDGDFQQSLASFGIPVPKVEVSSCQQ